MKVMMVPHKGQINGESGIKTLVNKYFEYLPKVGVELVDPHSSDFDVLAIHAGMSKEYGSGAPIVSHLHGLYWTADYATDLWQFKANHDVIDSIRHASQVTVPSPWVAESLQRDMHLNPHVLPHGIDWWEWLHTEPNEGYVLWNKNRSYDVCTPKPVGELALRFPSTNFQTTFAPPGDYTNILTLGLVPHAEMRRKIQRCGVYLATTKETFGIGTLEAMAAGKPVLGFRHGGTASLITHGVNGYLAEPDNYDDLAEGLHYCLRHASVLGANGQQLVQCYGWKEVVEQLYGVYKLAAHVEAATVSVIVPCFNYGHVLERAVRSVLANNPLEVIIVNNNSTDNTEEIGLRLQAENANVYYLNEPKQGVAHARNAGLALAQGKYVCCLDADDEIKPGFLDVCVRTLESDRTLGLAYTKLEAVDPTGLRGVSAWPGEYNFDAFVKRQNQVPTCCVFRRDLAVRLGGYRQKYAPNGAGAEDAEFWFRMGEAGYAGKLATTDALFTYYLGGNVSGNREYREPDWLKAHAWTEGRAQPPFASVHSPANNLSHPVRQYDQPVVSVVIPVGASHVGLLGDALDSLEAQTFKQWEAVVVLDGLIMPPSLLTAYPFIQWTSTGEKKGAGAARNLGADMARGKFLLYLDADDWLEPDCIQRLVQTFERTNSIAYSDYIGHAIIEPELANQLTEQSRLLSYNSKTREAQIAYQSFDYDCVEALQQPRITHRGEFYIWNVVTSLVPKVWHDEVGGFDEEMPSWEDWKYWLDLARKGKCFARVPERLVNYRIHTGTRRALASADTEDSRQLSQKLVQYIQTKFQEGEKPVCGNCGTVQHAEPPALPQMSVQMGTPDGSLEIRLIDNQHGEHSVIGRATQTFYGYRKHGEVFFMNNRDIALQPHLFQIITPDTAAAPELAKLEPPVIKAPDPVPSFDFTTLRGVTAEQMQQLNERGIYTKSGFLMAPVELFEDIFTEKKLAILRAALNRT